MTSVAYTIGGVTDQTITYTYDTGTNQKGHLTGATDANHSLAWTYDAQGRVTGKGQTVGCDHASRSGTATTPTVSSRRIVLPSGKTITYGYNANGQVTSVTLNGSPTHDPEQHHLRPVRPDHGMDVGQRHDRQPRVRHRRQAHAASTTPARANDFGYDDAFRITGITDVADSTQSWTLGL